MTKQFSCFKIKLNINKIVETLEESISSFFICLNDKKKRRANNLYTDFIS